MSDEHSPLRIRKRQLVVYRNRGVIYSWLRAHYGRVTELLKSGEGTWPRLCAEMERHGVSDRLGGPPMPNPSIKVWRRLCEELEGSPVENRFKNYPSRIPKDWRPSGYSDPAPVIAPPVASLPGTLMRSPPPRGPGMSIMEKLTGQPDVIRKEPAQRAERDVDAEIAGLRQQMRKRAV